MFKQLCKHHLSRQPIFTPKTYNHAVTYNHASADSNLQIKFILRKAAEGKTITEAVVRRYSTK